MFVIPDRIHYYKYVHNVQTTNNNGKTMNINGKTFDLNKELDRDWETYL